MLDLIIVNFDIIWVHLQLLFEFERAQAFRDYRYLEKISLALHRWIKTLNVIVDDLVIYAWI